MGKLLEAKNLSVKFRKSDFTLRPLDFEINDGETVAIIGESGSGKTTLLKALSCLSDNDAVICGEVKFKGVSRNERTGTAKIQIQQLFYGFSELQ